MQLRALLVAILVASPASAALYDPVLWATSPPPFGPGHVRGGGYGGRVLAVGRDTIVIQCMTGIGVDGVTQEWEHRGVRTMIGDPLRISRCKVPGGRSVEFMTGVKAVRTRESVTVTRADGTVATFHRRDRAPYRIKASAALAAGTLPKEVNESRDYLLTDVRVGDEVTVDTEWVNGAWEIVRISIDRRPGGRVPPSNRRDLTHPWHERANAYQDWEDFGVPLPDKFDPAKTCPKPLPK